VVAALRTFGIHPHLFVSDSIGHGCLVLDLGGHVQAFVPASATA
jgi:hypothetical protein